MTFIYVLRNFQAPFAAKIKKNVKSLLSQNQIKTIPLRRYHRDLSNGANGSTNRHRMEKLFSSEVFIKHVNTAGIMPRGSSRGRLMDCTDSMLTMQK